MSPQNHYKRKLHGYRKRISGRISCSWFMTEADDSTSSEHHALGRWARKEKWWSPAFLNRLMAATRERICYCGKTWSGLVTASRGTNGRQRQTYCWQAWWRCENMAEQYDANGNESGLAAAILILWMMTSGHSRRCDVHQSALVKRFWHRIFGPQSIMIELDQPHHMPMS